MSEFSIRFRDVFTHVVLEVLAAKGKFRSDVAFINGVDPSTHRHDTIKQDRHPPSTASEFQFECILGRCQISARRTAVLSRERPRIV